MSTPTFVLISLYVFKLCRLRLDQHRLTKNVYSADQLLSWHFCDLGLDQPITDLGLYFLSTDSPCTKGQ